MYIYKKNSYKNFILVIVSFNYKPNKNNTFTLFLLNDVVIPQLDFN